MRSFFSIGILVTDIESARAELEAALATRFGEPVQRRALDWQLSICFSSQAPWLELVEGPIGSPWEPTPGRALDHLAWWSEDLASDIARLRGLGARVEVDGSAAGAMFAYLRLPESGLRVELIDASTRAAFHERWGLRDPHAPGEAPVDAGRLFQAGLTVTSIERAMEELTEAVGARWGTLVTVPGPASTVRVAFSAQAPHLELVERDGGGHGLDHLGFWSDELDADTTRMTAQGAALVVDGSEFGEPIRLFAPTPAAGLAIEFCGASERPGFRTRWGLPAGG